MLRFDHADVPMAEQWYWKHGRHLLGPMETAQLEQLVDQHRIADLDEVRLAGDETWLRGAEVKRLFAESGASATSSEAAARLLSQARRLHEPVEGARIPQRGLIARLCRASARLAGRFGGPVERLGETVWAVVEAAAQRLTRRFVLIVVAAVLAIVFVANLDFGGESRLRDVQAELSATWRAIDELQSRDVAAAEWQALSSAKRPGVERALTRLIDDSRRAPGRSTDSFTWLRSADEEWQTAHARNALVHAAQALITLLDDPLATGRAATAEIYHEHMTIADGLLREEASRVWSSAAGPERAESWSTELLGLVVFDAVLVLAGAWYWLSRRG